jgi:hypothetical protein
MARNSDRTAMCSCRISRLKMVRLPDAAGEPATDCLTPDRDNAVSHERGARDGHVFRNQSRRSFVMVCGADSDIRVHEP